MIIPQLLIVAVYLALCAVATFISIRVSDRHIESRGSLLAAALITDTLLLAVIGAIAFFQTSPLWQVAVSTPYLIIGTIVFNRRLRRFPQLKA